MVDMCSSRKSFHITSRIILFYKYDSFPVDCVKHFVEIGRNIAFWFLQVG